MSIGSIHVLSIFLNVLLAISDFISLFIPFSVLIFLLAQIFNHVCCLIIEIFTILDDFNVFLILEF